jgi:hypothetical protein
MRINLQYCAIENDFTLASPLSSECVEGKQFIEEIDEKVKCVSFGLFGFKDGF